MEGAEGDEVDVHGVEDELDRHEHQHGVAAGEHAVDADAEEDGAEEEELVEEQVVQISPPGQDDGADEGGEQEHRDDLERDEVGGEDRVADRGRVRPVDRRHPGVGGERRAAPAELVDQGVGHHAEQEQRRGRATEPVLVGEVSGRGRSWPG